MSTRSGRSSPSRRTMRGVRGVIMAGGRSERMRSTNGPLHKALVRVADRPLLEHNLVALYSAGIDDVVVVTSGSEPEIDAYLGARGQAIAQRFGARLDCWTEREPLGNAGIVGVLNDGERDLFVAYVDNLSSLAPRKLLDHHRANAAALTIAAHVFELRNPFGELEIETGFVRAYHEKPVRPVRISSGTIVVDPRAAALVHAHAPCGAAELCAATLAAGLPVAAYEHDELWVDVNDAAALARAQTMLASHAERFAW